MSQHNLESFFHNVCCQFSDAESPADIAKLLDAHSWPAQFVYSFFLRNCPRGANMNEHIFEVAARIVYGLGEIGLFTLAY